MQFTLPAGITISAEDKTKLEAHIKEVNEAEGLLVKDVSTKDSINKDVIKQRDDLKTKVGEKDTELSTLQQKIKDGDIDGLVSKGKYQEAMDLKEKEWSDKFEANNETLKGLKTGMKRGSIKSAINKGLLSAKVANVDKARAYIDTVFDFEADEKDGEFTAKVLKGHKILKEDGSSKSPSEAVHDFMVNGDNDEYLEGAGTGGSGSGGGSGDGSGGSKIFTREDIKGMSKEEFAKNEKEIDKQTAEGKIK